MSAGSSTGGAAVAEEARAAAETLPEPMAPREEVSIGDVPWEPAPRGWYLAVVAGSLPLLVLGMVASALADRLAFAGWAIVAGVGHALLLRAAWSRGWGASARLALALGWAALALFVFAALVARHGEILDLGYRALLWPVYTPVLTRPGTSVAAGVTLAVGSAAAAGRALLARRSSP